MSSFDWIVISLVLIYVVGEILAAQAGQLSNSRQLRKLSGRKSIGNMGGRGSSMARGSMYGGRGSAIARGSFMVNMGITEEDENNDEFEDKTQPGIPEVIPEVDEQAADAQSTHAQAVDEESAEISDKQDNQEALDEFEDKIQPESSEVIPEIDEQPADSRPTHDKAVVEQSVDEQPLNEQSLNDQSAEISDKLDNQEVEDSEKTDSKNKLQEKMRERLSKNKDSYREKDGKSNDPRVSSWL